MIERETWTWRQADNLNSYIRIEKWGGGPPEFVVYLESPLPLCPLQPTQVRSKSRQNNGITHPVPLLQTIDMGLGPIPRAAHNPFPFLAERKGSPLHLQRASSSLGWTDIAQGGQRERIEDGAAFGVISGSAGRRGFPCAT